MIIKQLEINTWYYVVKVFQTTVVDFMFVFLPMSMSKISL